jgi:phosphohistidine phosphatase SixA
MKKIFVVILAVVCFAVPAFADGTYYVVRHAEKMDGDNPVLTQKGVKRAAHIVSMLKNEPIKAVYSTETYRTVMTATPTAADRGLAVQLFSTDDLAGFADQLKAMDGTFLIVAHSSSTPDLASLLSGTTQPKLAETDYEQLFKVVIKDGVATLTQTTTTFE